MSKTEDARLACPRSVLLGYWRHFDRDKYSRDERVSMLRDFALCSCRQAEELAKEFDGELKRDES